MPRNAEAARPQPAPNDETPIAVAEAPRPSPAGADPEGADPEGAEKKKRRRLVIAVVAAVVVLGALVYYLYGRRFEDTDDAEVDANISSIGSRVGGTVTRVNVAEPEFFRRASALVVTRLMRSSLFGMSPTDPVTFVGVAMLLVAVGVAGCLVPAQRAMRVDPLVALRHQ